VEREILELRITDEALEYSHASECRLNERDVERVVIRAHETKCDVWRIWSTGHMTEGSELLSEQASAVTIAVGVEATNEASLDEVTIAGL